MHLTYITKDTVTVTLSLLDDWTDNGSIIWLFCMVPALTGPSSYT